MSSHLDGINEVIELRSNTSSSCKYCDQLSMNATIGDEINHYLKHGFRLLHVGSETENGDRSVYHTTVAIMGK